MAQKYISCYTEGSDPKKWILVDNDYYETIFTQGSSTIKYRKNGDKVDGTPTHPSGLTTDMQLIQAKVMNNLMSGKSGWSGLKNEGQKIYIADGSQTATTTTTSYSASPSAQQAAQQVAESVQQAKETIVEKPFSLLGRFIAWLFGGF